MKRGVSGQNSYCLPSDITLSVSTASHFTAFVLNRGQHNAILVNVGMQHQPVALPSAVQKPPTSVPTLGQLVNVRYLIVTFT